MRYELLEFKDMEFPLIAHEDQLERRSRLMFMHWHHAVEIILVKEGRLRIISGKSNAFAEKGNIVCIHSGNMHLYEAVTERCSYDCIIFPKQALGNTVLYRSALPRVTADAKARQYLKQLLQAQKERPPFYRDKCRALLLELYLRLVELGGEECYNQEQNFPKPVQNALEYINTHYWEPPLSVKRIAKAAGVSRYHLSHLFKEVMGTTLSAYWIGLRCDLVRRYLAEGISVADAAYWAGFSSQSYLTRAYKKHYGVTPGKDKP